MSDGTDTGKDFADPAGAWARYRMRVPATTANLGPGFDCIGMAFDLYNYIDFAPWGEAETCLLSADGAAGAIELGRENLIYRAYRAVFAYLGEPARGVRMHFENNIPYSRGLGSSSAALIGGVKVANTLLGDPLTERELLHIALQLEGHPDNIAPALLGGIVISGLDAEQNVFFRKIKPPEGLCCTVLIPDYPLPTQAARAVLPQTVPMRDAVFNVGRMALLIDALYSGDLAQLAVAMEDRLHQPYRQPLIKGMEEVIPEAKALGALAVTISGAGPTLLLVSEGPKDFSSLAALLRRRGVEAQIRELHPVCAGAELLRAAAAGKSVPADPSPDRQKQS